MILSKRFSLNKEDWLKIWKGFRIALTGAIIAFLLSFIPQIPTFFNTDQVGVFGIAVIGSICSGIVNLVIKWQSSTIYINPEDSNIGADC